MNAGGAARRLARRIIRAAGRLVRLQWFVTNVAPAPPAAGVPALPPGVSVRPGSRADADAIAGLVSGRESLEWRFGRGDVVLVAEQEGLVIGCTWLTRQPLRPSYFPVGVTPAPGQWYNYGLALLRAHRTRGVGRALSRAAMAHAAHLGGSIVFGHASHFNRVAAASHRAAGFVTVEDLIGVTLLDRFGAVLYRRARAATVPGWPADGPDNSMPRSLV